MNTCLFKVIPCTNHNCQEEVQRQHHEQHVTVTCQWRIVECKYCCEPHPASQMPVKEQIYVINLQYCPAELSLIFFFLFFYFLFFCSLRPYFLCLGHRQLTLVDEKKKKNRNLSPHSKIFKKTSPVRIFVFGFKIGSIFLVLMQFSPILINIHHGLLTALYQNLQVHFLVSANSVKKLS